MKFIKRLEFLGLDTFLFNPPHLWALFLGEKSGM